MTLLLLLLCAVSSLAAAQDTSPNVTINANEIVDRLLREARENEYIRNKINPVRVKRVNLDDGKGYVEDITIRGLPSLAREGDVNVTVEGLHLVAIVGRLRAEDLRTEGRYLYRPSRWFRLRGRIAATLSYIAVEIGIQLDPEHKRGNVTVFKVDLQSNCAHYESVQASPHYLASHKSEHSFLKLRRNKTVPYIYVIENTAS
ncbi:hypothetical protein V5799_029041 [Amblyomma americanum]|uniref:Secreted protein n=1 Tax=Amblyomma americanum TaxID=6943 RepID=A0AAQ4ESC3_AMBAM